MGPEPATNGNHAITRLIATFEDGVATQPFAIDFPARMGAWLDKGAAAPRFRGMPTGFAAADQIPATARSRSRRAMSWKH